jgi:hypothetical protein
MLLSTCANQVIQEFGGVVPENLLSFEDAMREFLSVRALELQKVGASTTDLTCTKLALAPSSRDALVGGSIGNAIPAFAELTPSSDSTGNTRYKVEILPTELVPAYEGARVIAFYGTPTRYRLGWDAWNEGTLILWYDPIEDLSLLTSATDLTFPPAFWTFIIKKAAFNLVRLLKLKLVALDPANLTTRKADLVNVLTMFEQSLIGQVGEWQAEFRKYINLDLNSQSHLRRTSDEIRARGYDNVSGLDPLDLAG